MNSPIRRTPIRAAAVLATLVLSACGSADPGSRDDSSASDATTTPSGADEACARLTGQDGLVARALAVADRPLEERGPVQDELFQVVASGPAELQDPAGQLVDYLDDPSAYEPLDGGPDDVVTAAQDDIAATCS